MQLARGGRNWGAEIFQSRLGEEPPQKQCCGLDGGQVRSEGKSQTRSGQNRSWSQTEHIREGGRLQAPTDPHRNHRRTYVLMQLAPPPRHCGLDVHVHVSQLLPPAVSRQNSFLKKKQPVIKVSSTHDAVCKQIVRSNIHQLITRFC